MSSDTLRGRKVSRKLKPYQVCLEKDFIRAEVVGFDDFLAGNGEQGAKDAGKWRLEGKEYVMHEGDVVHSRFNI